MKNRNIKEIYSLPSEVKFCKKCVISNQRPRIKFDNEGICSACRFSEYKNSSIDWIKREKELKKLCDENRKDNSQYDVIVPGSGGKDSNYVAHLLKYQYGMNPLIITWSPHIYTDIGRKNLTSMIDSGFDNVLVTPDGSIHRKMTKAAFVEMGDPFQPFIFGQYSAPFRYALFYDIKIVFYGEDGEVEYGGSMDFADRPSLKFNDFTKHRFSGVYPKSFENYNISSNELSKYGLNEDELAKLKSRKIEQHFFSYYKKWIPQENFYYASENTGFEVNPERTEGTFTKYASLDDKLDGFHYYLSYIKFGIGRSTSDAAHEIRDGNITREEGVELVRKFDGEFPKKYFKEFLDYCDIDESFFYEVIDSWRNKNLWDFKDNKWKLKYKI